jgi:hypothetical protein
MRVLEVGPLKKNMRLMKCVAQGSSAVGNGDGYGYGSEESLK